MKKTIRFCFAAYFLLCSITKIDSQISSSSFHTLTICANGQVMSWGENAGFECGDGTSGAKYSPVQAIGLSNILKVAAGDVYSLVLKSDSTVWAWGNNAYGQLGNGTTTYYAIPVPAQISGLSNIVAIDAEAEHCLALKSDGTVWGWGRDNLGQLGDGGYPTPRMVPVQIAGLSNIIAIAGGKDHSFALKNDGTVWVFGYCSYGLGDGSGSVKYTPVKINSLSNITRIEGGTDFTFAFKSDGTVWGWGRNDASQLGDGTSVTKSTPVQINNLSNMKAIAAGNLSCLGLKADGSVWSWGANGWGQLGDGTTLGKNAPVRVNNLDNVIAVTEGSEYSIALKNDGTVWSFGRNDFGQLGDGTSTMRKTPVQVTGLCYIAAPAQQFDHYVHGTSYADGNSDCVNQSQEIRFAFPVVVTPGSFYAFPNDSAEYSFGADNSVNYGVSPVVLQRFKYMVKNPCPGSHSISLNTSDPLDVSGFDFGFDYSPCHLLRVDISSDRRRRCFKNNTKVFYINEGVIPANGVEVHVKMPSYVFPLSASLPYTWDVTDSSMVFTVGTLDPNQSGTISIIDSVACINGITGITQCTKAWILPPNTCLLDSTASPSWDHSSLKVSGTCVNDTIHFLIHNDGTGNMATASQYRIYSDNVLTQTVPFQLNSGASLPVIIVSGGATIRLEADQNPGHPGNSRPRSTIESCGTNGSGTYSTGMVNQVLMDDEDVNVEIDCQNIRDSYDPNEKVVSPEGVDAAHQILQGTQLDYTIHFQNTGSDTAYKVVIVDTLSPYFDISTLEQGVASHSYTLGISGTVKPILTFTFNNINLPDSTSDEEKSHGFVKFKIAPLSTTPSGTRINNFAGIYFDYNFPIITNTAFVTMGSYSLPLSITEKAADEDLISVYPNPARDKFIVNYKGISTANITVTDMLGKVYDRAMINPKGTIAFDVSDFPSGIYFVSIKNSQRAATEKVVIIK